jgi:hypothetical protein
VTILEFRRLTEGVMVVTALILAVVIIALGMTHEGYPRLLYLLPVVPILLIASTYVVPKEPERG